MPTPSPWMLRAWPPVLHPARGPNDLQFEHLGTMVTSAGDRIGQTLWGSRSAQGEAGVAWDWVQLPGDAVAMADPMSVVTNIRLLGDAGEVLTAQQAARRAHRLRPPLPAGADSPGA